MSALEKSMHLGRLPSRPPLPGSGGSQSGAKMRMGPGRKRDFSPVSWSQYFESMEDVEVENETGKDTFRVYKSGSEGPVLLLLHGGGHSALSWAVFTAAIISRVQCRIVALDLRGHGETKVKNSEDLSAETMAKYLRPSSPLVSASFLPLSFPRDLVFVLFFQGLPSETQNFLFFLQTKKDHPYTWRIELAKTEKYWDGWFRGLSNLFLSCPIPKLLLLAGVDRLDKDLTIGQMQGKFQMQVLPQCGHAVHEDAPDKVAEAVATFLIRHRFAEPIGGFQCVFPGC
ncbi:protein phosphatase methylesterase 1 [Leptonychotes weddellii]|uniref:Protein phosphatase methylesterase 1 n=1 Tax=Leptonychotes weddellii TaxID=9713 RepID=A0A7F8QHW6_LEPWE|nr:protein phosphatase methylesterase 1 [Leptonychotes weddellii]